MTTLARRMTLAAVLTMLATPAMAGDWTHLRLFDRIRDRIAAMDQARDRAKLQAKDQLQTGDCVNGTDPLQTRDQLRDRVYARTNR